MLCLSWNIGAQSKARVQEIVEREAPDILCLQETRNRTLHFPRYAVAAHSEDGPYAGVALLVRHGITWGGDSQTWIRGRVVCCTVGDVHILCAYLRNDVFVRRASKLRDEDDAVLHAKLCALRMSLGATYRVMFMGDLNLCLCFGDHHSHKNKVYDPRRKPSAKVARMQRTVREAELEDVGGQGSPWTFAHRRGLHLGGRYDYVLATPGLCRDYRVLNDVCNVDHFPVCCLCCAAS